MLDAACYPAVNEFRALCVPRCRIAKISGNITGIRADCRVYIEDEKGV